MQKVIQGGTTVCTYNRMNAGAADTVEGAEDTIRVRGASNTLHGLLKFTSSQIPQGHITKATLSFYCIGKLTGQKISIAPCLRAWTAAGATWNKYDGSNAWATAGGTGTGDKGTDVVSAGEPTLNSWWDIDLPTTTVEGWRDSTNNGVVIYYASGGDNNTTDDFDAPLSATAGQRPKLTVTIEDTNAGYFEV